MTEENQLRLYKHYVYQAEHGRDVILGTGNLTQKQMAQRNVKMMLKAYPHFANSEEKEEVVVKPETAKERKARLKAEKEAAKEVE